MACYGEESTGGVSESIRRRGGSGREMWVTVFIVISIDKYRGVRRSRFSGFWDIQAVPSCLAPDTGVIRVE